MSGYFGYIRVSTTKQGEGVSLQEQRAAIERYARANNREVIAWFEEKETAAKRGRPVFSEMLRLLRQGKAHGVMIHKIDRSARNLRDWADLGDLIDAGIEIHFANESLDLKSRGGRLSADIQAVVAADYIRNLREEARKGFYGRLKQGLLPMRAPLGYLDCGGGNPKEPDPERSELIRDGFELYSTSKYSLKSLRDEMYKRGLRNRQGRKVSINAWQEILNNPFYIGLIKVRTTGEVFEGCHRPIVNKAIFDRVQLVLRGKRQTVTRRHSFLFRQLLVCKSCGYSLIGERQKGHVYYRCHTKDCSLTGIREELAEQNMLASLCLLKFDERETDYLRGRLPNLRHKLLEKQAAQLQTIQLRLGQIGDRLNRLTDAFIDGSISKDMFDARRIALLDEKKGLEEKVEEIRNGDLSIAQRVEEILELAASAYLQYETAIPEEKRDLLRKLTLNRTVEPKHVAVELYPVYQEIANRVISVYGGGSRDIPRTLDRLLHRLIEMTSAERLLVNLPPRRRRGAGSPE